MRCQVAPTLKLRRILRPSGGRRSVQCFAETRATRSIRTALALPKIVHLDGVIDDKFRGEKRMERLGFTAHFMDGFRAGSENQRQRGHGEILEIARARGMKAILFCGPLGPLASAADVVCATEAPS